jgi:hypothetical protein
MSSTAGAEASPTASARIRAAAQRSASSSIRRRQARGSLHSSETGDNIGGLFLNDDGAAADKELREEREEAVEQHQEEDHQHNGAPHSGGTGNSEPDEATMKILQDMAATEYGMKYILDMLRKKNDKITAHATTDKMPAIPDIDPRNGDLDEWTSTVRGRLTGLTLRGEYYDQIRGKITPTASWRSDDKELLEYVRRDRQIVDLLMTATKGTDTAREIRDISEEDTDITPGAPSLAARAYNAIVVHHENLPDHIAEQIVSKLDGVAQGDRSIQSYREYANNLDTFRRKLPSDHEYKLSRFVGKVVNGFGSHYKGAMCEGRRMIAHAKQHGDSAPSIADIFDLALLMGDENGVQEDTMTIFIPGEAPPTAPMSAFGRHDSGGADRGHGKELSSEKGKFRRGPVGKVTEQEAKKLQLKWCTNCHRCRHTIEQCFRKGGGCEGKFPPGTRLPQKVMNEILADLGRPPVAPMATTSAGLSGLTFHDVDGQELTLEQAQEATGTCVIYQDIFNCDVDAVMKEVSNVNMHATSASAETSRKYSRKFYDEDKTIVKTSIKSRGSVLDGGATLGSDDRLAVFGADLVRFPEGKFYAEGVSTKGKPSRIPILGVGTAYYMVKATTGRHEMMVVRRVAYCPGNRTILIAPYHMNYSSSDRATRKRSERWLANSDAGTITDLQHDRVFQAEVKAARYVFNTRAATPLERDDRQAEQLPDEWGASNQLADITASLAATRVGMTEADLTAQYLASKRHGFVRTGGTPADRTNVRSFFTPAAIADYLGGMPFPPKVSQLLRSLGLPRMTARWPPDERSRVRAALLIQQDGGPEAIARGKMTAGKAAAIAAITTDLAGGGTNDGYESDGYNHDDDISDDDEGGASSSNENGVNYRGGARDGNYGSVISRVGAKAGGGVTSRIGPKLTQERTTITAEQGKAEARCAPLAHTGGGCACGQKRQHGKCDDGNCQIWSASDSSFQWQ